MTPVHHLGDLFFLSYAHPPPLPGKRAGSLDDAEESVAQLFADLGEAVRRVSHDAISASVIGSYDQLNGPVPVSKAELPAVLASAQVFVPLYSPRYFSTTWSRREWRMFQERSASAGVSGEERIVPILWEPFLSWDQPTQVERALSAWPDLLEYRRQGLRRLQHRAEQAPYSLVVNWVARAIVDLAQNHPIRPSPTPQMDQVREERTGDPRYLVTYLMPDVTGTATPGDQPGQESWWRANAISGRPAAVQRTADAAERLGLNVEVEPWESAWDRMARFPTVVLLDPAVGETWGPDVVITLTKQLPAWAGVVILQPAANPGQASEKVVESLRSIPGLHQRVVHSQDDLSRVLPPLISRTCQTFLRNRPPDPARTGTRRPPRLSRWPLKESPSDE